MNLAAFTRAGLKQKEIGTIVGVSHTTVGLWMRGQRAPHFLHEHKVQTILDAVDSAVTAGDLPLPPTIRGEDRMEYIKEIIDKHS